MAKVKINSLPPGITIENGKIVKRMQKGGLTTGDQYDFGLTTTVKTPTNNSENTNNIRYSLNSVPRDQANIEAEGGETVLTDLNNDGLFGLYDIKGPRHSSGGVPLNLPEQSFIFSDTKKMKLGGQDLQAFGIKSRKKMTPADISKKYDLNKYYGAIKDEYADDIQVRSAELMMDKNKNALSKLAFVQESKKDFEDGVPAASYPYLVSQGIDPIDFTARVEQISQEKAFQKAINALPPQQQAQIMMLQELINQAQGAQPQMLEQPGPEQILMAKDGRETPPPDPTDFYNFIDIYAPPTVDAVAPYAPGYVPQYLRTDTDDDMLTQQPVQTSTQAPAQSPYRQSRPPSKTNQVFDAETMKKYQDLGFVINTGDIEETKYADVQPQQGPNLFGDAGKNLQGFNESWSGIYPGLDDLNLSLETYQGSGQDYNNPGVLSFQKWYDNDYIPQRVKDLNADLVANGYEPLTAQQMIDLEEDLKRDLGFSGKQKKDGKLGTYVSAKQPINWDIKPKEVKDAEDAEDVFTQDSKEGKKIKEGELGKLRKNPEAQLWLQDLIQLNAIANRDREMFLPFQPGVANVDLGYVLEDPTRAIASINERLGIQTQAAGAFGGPQALAARTAQAQGRAAAEIANELARVNQRNVGTINQGLAMQAQATMGLDRERRDRTVKQYDDTQAVLQRYMDEKNYDREQYAQALSNALTNRANTYNLNSIQDYYQIDPSSGGMIGQFSGKAFEPAPLPDPYANIKQYAEMARMFKAAGIEPTPELIQGAMGVPTQQLPQETNAARAMRTSPYFGYTSLMNQPEVKNGIEMEETILPFYMGLIGG